MFEEERSCGPRAQAPLAGELGAVASPPRARLPHPSPWAMRPAPGGPRGGLGAKRTGAQQTPAADALRSLSPTHKRQELSKYLSALQIVTCAEAPQREA